MTTINSQEDFLRALSENPEWRAAVRAQILGDELLQLPAKFDAFVERMDGFIEEQKQFNGEIKAFVEEQKQFNGEIRAFVEEQKQFNAEMRQFNSEMKLFLVGQRDINERLIRRMDRITNDTAQFKGWLARLAATDSAPGIAIDMGMEYVRTITRAELALMAHNAAGGDIPTSELRSFRDADVVIEATLEGSIHYIAVEASYTGDRRDTDRALRNADFLTRFTGIPARAAVVSVRNDRELDPLIMPGHVYWYPIPDSYMEPE